MKDISSIIQELNKQIDSSYSDYQGTYLYGSYARSENNAQSDIDLVVLFQNTPTYTDRLKLWTLVSKIEAENNIVLDIHPTSYKELEKNPVYYNQVINKGIFYGV